MMISLFPSEFMVVLVIGSHDVAISLPSVVIGNNDTGSISEDTFGVTVVVIIPLISLSLGFEGCLQKAVVVGERISTIVESVEQVHVVVLSHGEVSEGLSDFKVWVSSNGGGNEGGGGLEHI